jgi:Ras-related protein Rab-21
MEKKSGSACKIVVLGEARVGKTSLTVRFCKNQFDERQESTVDASCLE